MNASRLSDPVALDYDMYVLHSLRREAFSLLKDQSGQTFKALERYGRLGWHLWHKSDDCTPT